MSRGLSQPLCAAFISPANQETFVAWNPHQVPVTVNWWKVGTQAGSGGGALSQDLVVPPGWYAVASTAPPTDAQLVVNVNAPGKTGPGSTVTYNVTVTATGSGPVSGVVVSEYLPYTVAYVSSSPQGTVSGNAVRLEYRDTLAGVTQSYLVTGHSLVLQT